ncbi:MAG TPA: DUF1844 domain-containing protein [Polyangiaceae bacterium]|jgi:hypothetical protein
MAYDDEEREGTSDAAGEPEAADAKEEDLPAVDFATFILSLSHSALVHLGDAPNPADGKREISLPMARQTIDLLTLLQEKTLGRLSGEEERIMDQALYDLRMRYLEVAKSK